MVKKVFRGPDTLFYNAQCLFVEYHDVIQSPWFLLLMVSVNHEKLNEIFDMSELKHLDMNALYEWYVNRKERNIYKNFRYIGPELSDEEFENQVDVLLYKNEISGDMLYRIDSNDMFLNFITPLQQIATTSKGIVKKIVIYSEYKNAFIESFALRLHGSNVVYKYGKFEDVLKTIPTDSTFVLSDMNKMNIIKNENRLDCTSFIIVDGYRYNRNEDGEFVFDYEKEMETSVFKLSFFNGLYLEESDE